MKGNKSFHIQEHNVLIIESINYGYYQQIPDKFNPETKIHETKNSNSLREFCNFLGHFETPLWAYLKTQK